MLQLDVCIIAYRKAGLERIVAASHPKIEGVRYIVAWQYSEDSPEDIPSELINREDFIIIPNSTIGGGANRQVAFERAEADLVLLSDDDVEYRAEYIQGIIKEFVCQPDRDFLLLQSHSTHHPRKFPDHEFDAKRPPKGYFIGGPEIAFRRKSVITKDIRFNPLFGRGAKFCAGEDSLFLNSMIKAGLHGRFLPKIVCIHEGDSTGVREILRPDFIRAKGAMFCYLHPHTWPGRMLIHALRLGRTPTKIVSYISNWLKGVRDLHHLQSHHT